MDKIVGGFGVPTPIVFYKDSFFAGSISEIAQLATGDTMNIERYPTFWAALQHIEATIGLTWDGHICGLNGWTKGERENYDKSMFCDGAVKVVLRETKALVNNTEIKPVVLHEVDFNTIAMLAYSTLRRRDLCISNPCFFDYLCKKIQEKIDVSGCTHISDIPAVMSNPRSAMDDFYRNVLHMDFADEKPYVLKPAYYTISVSDLAKEYNRVVPEILSHLHEYHKEWTYAFDIC